MPRDKPSHISARLPAALAETRPGERQDGRRRHAECTTRAGPRVASVHAFYFACVTDPGHDEHCGRATSSGTVPSSPRHQHGTAGTSALLRPLGRREPAAATVRGPYWIVVSSRMIKPVVTLMIFVGSELSHGLKPNR